MISRAMVTMEKACSTMNALNRTRLMILSQVFLAGMNFGYAFGADDGMDLRVMVAYRFCIAAGFIAYLAFLLQGFHVCYCSPTPSSSLMKQTTPIPSVKTLKMKTGVCYKPKVSKVKPLGEDAYFIDETKHTFGLTDGVGGWAKHGIDAGQYARELMCNALDIVQRQPSTGAVDPKQVLNDAYLKTEAKGSSTACIVTLKDKVLHAVNIGDSGFVVIRGKNLVFETKPQLHYGNCPYQLMKSSTTRKGTPDVANEISVQVECGDVVVAGTDGLFDNVYKEDIGNTVRRCVSRGYIPGDTAKKIAKTAKRTANRAKLESVCRSSVCPFMKARLKAPLSFLGRKGGKYDDITVVVAYIL